MFTRPVEDAVALKMPRLTKMRATRNEKCFFFVHYIAIITTQTIMNSFFPMLIQNIDEKMDGNILEFQPELSPSESSEPEVAIPAVTVVEYDRAWPGQFQRISEKLRYYLEYCGAKYLTVEHVGSTAIPGLIAKSNLDIIIEVPDTENAEIAKEALIHEPPPEEHYRCFGDGGIRGRISMKVHDRSVVPDQSVYIISRNDPEGRLIMRCHRALRDTLRLPEHEALKVEYGQTKMELASTSRDGVEYGQKKNPIIRRILRAAGWTDVEVDEKESLDYRIPGDDLPY